MNLQTPVELPATFPAVNHAQELLLMGSCFAENIGTLLKASKFRCDVNPFGILYNPLSVSAALRQVAEGKVYTEEELFFFREAHHSLMHHSSFSSPVADNCLSAINARLQEAHGKIEQIDHLLITFGTAWVYMFKETGKVAGNCHKLPDSEFERRRLEPEEIVEDYVSLIEELTSRNPGLHVWLTVSPIRHVKDGMHGNQLSKGVLLLAADRLQKLFPDRVCYFPAYEIMLDELRDYRFYADDMLHPSPLAIQYIREIFGRFCFSSETQKLIKECESIGKALAHRPFRDDSEEYKSFLGQILLKIERLTEKYPNLDVNKEIEICHTRLKR